jgi:hypothetical protein
MVDASIRAVPLKETGNIHVGPPVAHVRNVKQRVTVAGIDLIHVRSQLHGISIFPGKVWQSCRDAQSLR